MGAIKGKDRELLAEELRQQVGDSLDLDGAMQAESPNAHRWDYLLSLPDSSKIIGVEPHPATDSEVGLVIDKKGWAVGCLKQHFQSSYRVGAWYWVSSGKIGLSKTDRAGAAWIRTASSSSAGNCSLGIELSNVLRLR